MSALQLRNDSARFVVIDEVPNVRTQRFQYWVERVSRRRRQYLGEDQWFN